MAPPARPADPGGLLDPVAAQVETTLFRALAVLRLVVATYAVLLDVSRWREFEHPVAGWVVVAVIVVWTVVASWAYDEPRRRGLPLLVADFLVAAGALAATPYVQSDAMMARHASTMPSFWIITAVLAWAVARGWVWGLGAALVMSALDLSVRTSVTGTTWGNIFLLLLAAGVVGYSTGLIREASEARAEAERIAAVLSERARLARAVHDGVLQVLALVQRRGTELGGEAAELGRLAGDQEVALRALVQGDVVAPAGLSRTGSGLGAADLVSALSTLGSRSVTVSGPGQAVLLPSDVVEEVRSVVRACLDNVARHVGPEAPAWVLVERVADRVVVTVRDEGPGIPPGRLEQARNEGRLGVAASIQGRMAAVGGVADLVTGPGQGTEWELCLAISTAGAGAGAGAHSK
jgi:signal transduction histidine kinase